MSNFDRLGSPLGARNAALPPLRQTRALHGAATPAPELLYADSLRETPMNFSSLALAATFVLACAAPAAAQRYTAKQNGELIELADATAQMNVSSSRAMSNAWKIQVKGQNLVRTSATLESSWRGPGYNGMPLLAPFANRLDETAFYANGKKYNFDLELGNMRGPIPGTGFVNGTDRTGSSSSSRPTRRAPGSPAGSISTRTRRT